MMQLICQKRCAACMHSHQQYEGLRRQNRRLNVPTKLTHRRQVAKTQTIKNSVIKFTIKIILANQKPPLIRLGMCPSQIKLML